MAKRCPFTNVDVGEDSPNRFARIGFTDSLSHSVVMCAGALRRTRREQEAKNRIQMIMREENMRTSTYPGELEGGSVALQNEDDLRRWFVLYTASHNEKAVERALRQKGVETFLPLYRVTKRRKNRTTVKLDLPLFASYVFARIALSESMIVRNIPRVFAIVGNGRGPLPLPDAEIEALRAGLTGENATPWAHIKVGTRARINNGPLAGLEGLVVRSDDKLRVVLSMDMISKSIAVHVCAEDIDICEELTELERSESARSIR
jgi:transcription antitermination factor NusG